MTAASKSVYYFGIYLAILSVTLLAVPNMLLELFHFEPTHEVWIRVVGTLVFVIATMDIFMARANNVLFLTITVYSRFAVLLWFILFVALGFAPAQLILFGLVDAAGAAWTLLALRKG